MTIRKANKTDIEGLNRLLYQVAAVHHEGRPDLFKPNAKKYTDQELEKILGDPDMPVLAAFGESGEMLGYAFCQLTEHKGEGVLTDIRTLYLDDLCVDEAHRGQHIGREICAAVMQMAREMGCYNVTLNVWECNPSAMKFYLAEGMKPYKTGMEMIL